MVKHWKRSRVLKALTDAGRAKSFSEAEAWLDAVLVAVVAGADQVATPAGQAAILTAVATARKCFGRVTLVMDGDAPLLTKVPIGKTLRTAARRLGARAMQERGKKPTHAIRVGETTAPEGWSIRCWWDRWLSGTRATDGDPIGESGLALAGVFAAALAVRQIFAGVLAGRPLRPRDASISLWMPWALAGAETNGPCRFDVPDKFWFLGLGHLGQGFVWNLCLLGAQGGGAVVQDDQAVSDENEPTSLLVLPGKMGEHKARLAAHWLEPCGWKTAVIERRHQGDIQLAKDDPPYLLCGLDRFKPRQVMARHGFEFMIDAGLGHGPVDFEGIQLRVIGKGQSADGLWNKEADAKLEERSETLFRKDAYIDLEKTIGRCGIVSFAEASTAVPFVGAATGALVIAQAIRLASLLPARRFMQMELGSPEMVTAGNTVGPANANLGSTSLDIS